VRTTRSRRSALRGRRAARGQVAFFGALTNSFECAFLCVSTTARVDTKL